MYIRLNNKNKAKIIYRVFLYVLFTITASVFTAVLYTYVDTLIPSTIYLHCDMEESIELNVPATGKICQVESSLSPQIPTEQISVDLNKPVTLRARNNDAYCMDIKLFGFLPFKQVEIKTLEKRSLMPVGLPIGMYIETDGLLVVGIGEFETYEGDMCSPVKNQLFSGDYILEINQSQITTKEELIDAVKECGGKQMSLKVKRKEKVLDITVTPVKNKDDVYKLGIWVRDNSQGVGTMTYIDDEGNFGALGHGINDVDTGELMEMSDGTLYQTQIVGIKKGYQGAPGELTGRIVYDDNYILGDIIENTKRGIFGVCNEQGYHFAKGDALPIGLKQEVEEGPAQIICTFEDGTPDYYDICITKLHMNHENINRGIELQISDVELLKKTGGIVQGMSGSPIIQNGKIIGAVTHVFVDDPTKGYGIFIESMLN